MDLLTIAAAIAGNTVHISEGILAGSSGIRERCGVNNSTTKPEDE